MMHKILLGISIVTFATLITTPAPAPTGPHWDKRNCAPNDPICNGIHASKPTAQMTPPDPCLKFKQLNPREKCVTRQMNMNGIKGSSNTQAGTIKGKGDQNPY